MPPKINDGKKDSYILVTFMNYDINDWCRPKVNKIFVIGLEISRRAL